MYREGRKGRRMPSKKEEVMKLKDLKDKSGKGLLPEKKKLPLTCTPKHCTLSICDIDCWGDKRKNEALEELGEIDLSTWLKDNANKYLTTVLVGNMDDVKKYASIAKKIKIVPKETNA